MRHRRLRGSFLVPLACALGVAGCNLVLGIDDFTDAPANTGGGGSTGAGQQQVCTPGELKECLYTGPDATKDVGPCRAGTQACNDDGTGYEACAGEVLPAPKEDCGNVVDDDCNGEVNDGCPCTPNTTAPCYTGPAETQDVGICHAGTKTCNADGLGYGDCVGEQTPMTEDCATASDDDCNGKSFDDAAAGCMCEPNTTAPCYSGPAGTVDVGICKAGTKTCTPDGLGYGDCVGEQTPLTEDCATPGDEDCDGTPNQPGAGCLCTPGMTQPCYSGPMGTENVGICKGGTQTCNPDGLGYGACVGEQTPLAENCGTPQDEDCDGVANQPGAGCTCVPGTMTACYTGLAGTQGVGLCKGGMKTCNPDGKTYGACAGEVVPAAESCSNATDEDCDGFVCGETLWAKKLDGVSVRGVAVDGSGNIYVAGSLNSTFTMGAVSLSVVGGSGTDVVALKFNAAGSILWGKRFGSTSNDAAMAIAADAAGNIHLTGYLGGAVDFGGGNQPAGVFVVKLDPSGNHLWSKGCGGSTSLPTSMGRGIALDAQGNVLVTGSFGSTLSCAIGMSATSAGNSDVFVVRMSGANGGPIWTKGYGDMANNQYGYGIAAASNGDALVTGSFQGTINFGPGNLTAGGSGSLFVARLGAAAGAHVWSKSGGNGAVGSAIAVDASSNPIIAGSYSGATTLGGKTVQVPANGGASDILLGKLDAANGNALWLSGFGGANADGANAVAVSGAGRIAMGGSFRNSVDFGGGSLASASLDAAFLALFDGQPAHLWSKQFSSATLGPNAVDAIATGPNGEVVAGGVFYGSVDFGKGTLTAAGSGSPFLMRVAP